MLKMLGWLGFWAAAGLLAGCTEYVGDAEPIEQLEQALNICNETVPANRQVDGIPAYAQCADSQNSPIYSNNGVDTATASAGTGWVRTQYSGGYQCTELAHRYLYFHWNVTWIPNGNAGTWCDSTPPSTSGVVQATTPVHGDLIVFAPSSCGASASAGHVAVVDTVNSATQVTIVEQNGASRRNTNVSCARCFLHVVANDADAGAGGATGTGGTATGGTRFTGGSTARGGNPPGTGGTAPTIGGNAPVMGGTANTGGSGGDAGSPESCTCRVSSGKSGGSFAPLLLGLVGLLRRRRIRR